MFLFDFVTSDTHFSHKKIIEYSDRPFSSVGQMDGELIRRWNRTVGPTDVVLHLGDLALGPLESALPLTSALNGRKYLIPGNHDRISPAHRGGKDIARFTERYEAAGWTILPGIVHTEVAGHPVLLSHYPYEGDSHGADRHAHLRPIDEGLPLIHGHIHTEWAVNGRQFNAGVDVHGFAPVPVATITSWLDSL